MIIILAIALWAIIWGGLAAAIWSAKGGDGVTAFFAGAVLGVFAVAWCAFATPAPRREASAPGPMPAYEPAPELSRWRDRRLGAEGWAAVAVSVAAIGLMLLLVPRP